MRLVTRIAELIQRYLHKHTKVKIGKDIYQNVLGGSIGIVLCVLIFLLFTREIPQSNMNVLLLIIGSLISSFTTVVQYHFGSSKGSADKDKLLRKDDIPQKDVPEVV